MKIKDEASQQSTKASVFSFFAGAGFLDLGFEKAGFEVAFVNELHKPFLEAYRYAREELELDTPSQGYYEGDMGDLTKGEGKKLLTAKVSEARKTHKLLGFIGGPPCPDFSVAGKNMGKKGEHGKLSGIYTTLICQQKPDFFFFENVKGLWKTHEHRQFYNELKEKLRRKGYVMTEKLINSLEYGVAQDRDRIILVGFQESLLPHAIVNGSKIKEGVFPWQDAKKYSRENAVKIAKGKSQRSMPKPLTVQFWFDKNSVATHPNAGHHFKPHVLKKFRQIKEGDVSKKSFKRLHHNRYSPTAAYGNNEVHLHPQKHRRISVAEALAIQSLPRKFSFPATMTLSNMFKAVGNGVPYVAARAIAINIRKFLDKHSVVSST